MSAHKKAENRAFHNMSDTGSYNENIEVQEENYSDFGAREEGGGGGGYDNSGGVGDNISVSSVDGSSHHHQNHQISSYNYHTTYNYSGGGSGRHHHGKRGEGGKGGGGKKGVQKYYNNSKMLPGDGSACKPVIIVVCLVIITAGLYVFVSSSIENLKKRKNALKSESPLPSPPKTWSGHFSGFYLKRDDNAKDSTLTSNEELKAVANLDDQFVILKDDIVNGNATTTFYTVVKNLKKGVTISFTFTSGVNFTQRSIREGVRILEPSNVIDTDNFYWEEVPTTITVEKNVEGGKIGVWQEVQHSSPEVRVKRTFFDETFFDDEMTAIYQTKTEEPQKAYQWDKHVIKYHRINY